jgi:hypothetical protein
MSFNEARPIDCTTGPGPTCVLIIAIAFPAFSSEILMIRPCLIDRFPPKDHQMRFFDSELATDSFWTLTAMSPARDVANLTGARF